MAGSRRDARTNRARILAVAEDVFGRGGESASTEEVARLAGVGIATVFRHFPTKAALLEAVLLERFGRLREYAESLGGRRGGGGGADKPPGGGRPPPPTNLFFFWVSSGQMVEDAGTKIAIGEALV